MLVFELPEGGVLEIRANALRDLLQFRQIESHSSEAGGVLLGRIMTDSGSITIDKAGVPGEDDERRRFFFRRDSKRAQLLVDAAWEESQGTRNYVGEWHSHPEDDPSPSSHDLKEWKRIARQTIHDFEWLIFLIVGMTRIRAWRAHRDGSVVQLHRAQSTITPADPAQEVRSADERSDHPPSGEERIPL